MTHFATRILSSRAMPSLLTNTTAFTAARVSPFFACRRMYSTQDDLQKLVGAHKIVLFMKGV